MRCHKCHEVVAFPKPDWIDEDAEPGAPGHTFIVVLLGILASFVGAGMVWRYGFGPPDGFWTLGLVLAIVGSFVAYSYFEEVRDRLSYHHWMRRSCPKCGEPLRIRPWSN